MSLSLLVLHRKGRMNWFLFGVLAVLVVVVGGEGFGATGAGDFDTLGFGAVFILGGAT